MAGIFPRDIWYLLFRYLDGGTVLTMCYVSKRMREFMSPRQFQKAQTVSVARRAYCRYRNTCQPMIGLRTEDHFFLLKKVLEEHTQCQINQKNFSHPKRPFCDRYGLCWRCHVTDNKFPFLDQRIHLAHIDHDVICPRWQKCQWCGLAGSAHEFKCILRPVCCDYCDLFVPLPYLIGHKSKCLHKCSKCDTKTMPTKNNKLCRKHYRKKLYKRLVSKRGLQEEDGTT